MTDPIGGAPTYRWWTVAEADAYLAGLDRLLDSVRRAITLNRTGDLVRSDPRVLGQGLQQVLDEDGVIIRDLARGLVDFRARGEDGTVVLLCRVDQEPRIEWWHDEATGFAGRRRWDDDPPW